MQTLKKELKGLKHGNFLMLTIAGIINGFGVTVFLAPVKLYDSGISGSSMLLSQITPEFLSLSFFLFQVVKLKEITHKIDPLAYISISEVADVFSANHQLSKQK